MRPSPAAQALHIILLLQANWIAVWLPEAGGRANLDNPVHQALIMMLATILDLVEMLEWLRAVPDGLDLRDT